MKPKLSSVNFDVVAPLNPFDKTASMVSSQGNHYEAKFEKTLLHQDTPPPMRKIKEHWLAQPDFIDLTGKVINRLTVIGMGESREVNKDAGARWVVRCVCGNYEHRTAKAIKKLLSGKNDITNAVCRWCNQTRRLQEGYGRGLPEKIEVTSLFEKPQKSKNPNGEAILDALERQEDI